MGQLSHPHSNTSTKESCFKIAASFFLGLPAWHFLCAHPTFTTSWLEPFMDLQCQGFAFWQRSCWLTCAVWKHWHPTWAYWCCSGLDTDYFFGIHFVINTLLSKVSTTQWVKRTKVFQGPDLPLFRGLTTSVGAPLGGLVYEHFGSYDFTFTFISFYFILAGLLGESAHLINRK